MKTVISAENFNLDYTLDCGQVFRWQQCDGDWIGVVGGHMVRARQEGETLIIDSDLSRDRIIHYFRLDDDLQDIYARINKDAVMARLIKRFRGLRLIRQDPWECLVSYMASSCKSIPNIKDSISRLCRLYGDDLDGYYSFPTVQSLSQTTETQLRKAKLGFRAVYILEAARRVDAGDLDLEKPFTQDYEDARGLLMEMKGIGPKIADCVLLFAYDKMGAFPADTHILSIMREHYNTYLQGTRRTGIGTFARNYFGNWAGYAQQYLYYSRIAGNTGMTLC